MTTLLLVVAGFAGMFAGLHLLFATLLLWGWLAMGCGFVLLSVGVVTDARRA